MLYNIIFYIKTKWLKQPLKQEHISGKRCLVLIHKKQCYKGHGHTTAHRSFES